jgi:hypothetical protein
MHRRSPSDKSRLTMSNPLTKSRYALPACATPTCAAALAACRIRARPWSFSTPATPAMSSPAHAPATAPTSTGSPPTSPVPRPASSCSVPRPAGSSRWRAQRLATVLHPALLEAFEGKSDRPPPWLRVGDLQIWLAQRVKELSNGAQSPMTLLPFKDSLIGPSTRSQRPLNSGAAIDATRSPCCPTRQ